MRFCTLIALALAPLAMAAPADTVVDMPCQGGGRQESEKVGNGNPHQNFVFKQVSGTTDCTDNPSGGASVTKTQTVGWTLSEGFSSDFITGGFSVSESTSTGYTNTFGCKTNTGTHKGSLCVFERIQVTAFTARSRYCSWSTCPGGKNSCSAYKTGVIFAPNSVQGSCFYDNFQLKLPCGVLGSEHHINSGPAGGPQFIACEPSHV